MAEQYYLQEGKEIMGWLMRAGLKALPVVDSNFLGAHNMPNVRQTIAWLCGQTPSGIAKVQSNLKEYSDEELLEHLTPNIFHSLEEVERDAHLIMSSLALSGERGSWYTKGPFYVLYTVLYWGGPRAAMAFIMRTGPSTWQTSILSRYVLTE